MQPEREKNRRCLLDQKFAQSCRICKMLSQFLHNNCCTGQAQRTQHSSGKRQIKHCGTQVGLMAESTISLLRIFPAWSGSRA